LLAVYWPQTPQSSQENESLEPIAPQPGSAFWLESELSPDYSPVKVALDAGTGWLTIVSPIPVVHMTLQMRQDQLKRNSGLVTKILKYGNGTMIDTILK
jgi:hypothetical protein